MGALYTRTTVGQRVDDNRAATRAASASRTYAGARYPRGDEPLAAVGVLEGEERLA